ncbi:MAG: sugar ABC transporter substrate-binding protein [Anaerolineae bacterium]
MDKRFFWLIFVLLWLAACGSDATSSAVAEIDEPFVGDPPPLNPNIPKDNITLEVWLDLDFTKNDDLFEQIAQDFELAYPQVKIEIQSFVRESIPPKLKRALQVGAPPDVVQGHVYAMAGQGLAEPLSRRWQEWEQVDLQARKEFLPAAMEEVTWQDDLYGIPLDIYTLVLLYNRRHFAEANLPTPEQNYDIAAFSNAAAALTKPPPENRYGIGLTSDPQYVYTWLTSAGGDLLAGTPETGFTLTLNSKNNIDALRFLTEMASNGYGQRPTTRPHDYEDPRKQFLQEQVSMYFSGPWDIHLIQSTSPDFPLGVAQLPKTPAGESAASVLGSTGLFIPKGARHQDVAFEFMKWVTSDRYAIPMGRRLGRYPAKTWLPNSPYFRENLLLLPFFNQLKAARPYRLDVYPEAEQAFTDAVKAAFYGADPVTALNEAQKLGQKALEVKLP